MAKLLRHLLTPNYLVPRYLNNWFGTGLDGDVTIAVNTNLASVTDGDIVVKNYNSLTINAGCTLTTSTRCKGLLVFVRGDCSLQAGAPGGILTMSKRGANVDPVAAGVSANGIRLPMLKSGSGQSLSAADFSGCGTAAINAMLRQAGIYENGVIFQVKRTGAASQSAGDGYQTGGGGAATLAGGTGTCFSGGAGASHDNAGGANGGPGGAGAGNDGGGAGNPGGEGAGSGQDGEDGTGGLLFLIVGGLLTIGAGAIISANGANGGTCEFDYWGGAGSGGGMICIAHAGVLINNGSIQANGGVGTGGNNCATCGSNGGAGSIQIQQVDP